MPSRITTRQEKLARSLEAASDDFAVEVGRSLDNFWKAIVEEGQSLPLTEEDRIRTIGRWIASCREQVSAADDMLDWGLQDRHDMVVRNEQAAQELRAKLLAVRAMLEATFGSGRAKGILGLGPGLPDEPAVLQRIARGAIKKMQQPGFALPEALLQSSPLTPEGLIDEIEPFLERLESTLSALDPEKRGTQRALKHKRLAAEAHSRALGRGARYLEALFFLAGEDFLAERLRQSTRAAVLDEGEFLPPSEEPEEDDPQEPPEGGEDGETPDFDVEPPAALSSGFEPVEHGA